MRVTYFNDPAGIGPDRDGNLTDQVRSLNGTLGDIHSELEMP
jgi:hypothetical protein